MPYSTFLYVKVFAVPVLMLGWIFYQIVYRKKSFRAIESDLPLIAFFSVTWCLIYWALS